MYFLTAFLRNRLCPHIDNDPTDACKDNKKKKSRLSIITVFISYVKNSLANKRTILDHKIINLIS